MPSSSYKYIPTPGLTPEEHAVEERFGRLLEEDLAASIAAYRQRFGKVVSGDLAREFSPDYATADHERRGLLSRATYAPSRALALAVFKAILRDTAQLPGLVVFTQGGPGSGKTTSVDHTLSVEKPDLIFDSTLANFEQAKHLIDLALLAQKEVWIILTVRPLENAWRGVVTRAYEEEGRIVTLPDFYQKHIAARRTHDELRLLYSGKVRVNFKRFDNEPAEALSCLPAYETFQPLANLIVNEAHDKKYSDGLAGSAVTAHERFRASFLTRTR